MANRLVLASSFIAQAEEYGDAFLNLGFADYARFFEATKRTPFLYYRSSAPIKRKKTRFADCINIWNTYDKEDRPYSLGSPEFLTRQHDTRLLFVVGWSFRNPQATLKHREAIRRFFTPVAKHRDSIARATDQLRKGTDHLVGIHIRQTDYSTFANGKYFYSLDTYKSIMRRIACQLKGRTRFLLCSDITLEKSGFAAFDVALGPGHPLQDNCLLSACDYLAGPPSTYTLWASFYGSVPRFEIISQTESISLDAFKIIHGF